MRDTLLGVPLGKQFGSQSRPHNVGPALRAKLFATKQCFFKKLQDRFEEKKIIFAPDEKNQNGRNIAQNTCTMG